MTYPISIVGCGTVGSCLAIELAKRGFTSELELYDYDVISGVAAYPFLDREVGISKIRLIEFLCKKYNKCINVESHACEVTKPFKHNSFVIDCRDSKTTDIRAEMKISVDGYLLYISSIKHVDSEKTYHRYISARDEKYISNAVDIILNYFNNDQFRFRDMRLYNLRTSEMYIIEKEIC